MSEKNLSADEIAAAEAAKKAADDKAQADADAAASQDPLDKEIEKINRKKEERSELEKAEYKKRQLEKKIKELKGDDDDDDFPAGDDDEDAPVTVGMLKKLEAEKAARTSLQLADEITDEKERTLVKYHLENSIRSSGNPAEDLKIALSIVNSVKNAQIIEEAGRKISGRTQGTGTGAPARRQEAFEPTPSETAMMRPPFNLTKDQVIAARKLEAGQ